MNKMAGKNLSPRPAKGHGRQEVWTTKGAVRVFHSSTARQTSACAEAACASVSLRWPMRTKTTPSAPQKYKRPDHEVEASTQGSQKVTPRRQSTRGRCQFSLSWNWCLAIWDVLGDKPVLPSKTPSHPCWHPSCRRFYLNWNWLPHWMYFHRHQKAERHRAEDRWAARQDVVTLPVLLRRRLLGPLLRPRNQSPCSKRPSFGSWGWMNRWPVWGRFSEVLPALFLRRIDSQTPMHYRGC